MFKTCNRTHPTFLNTFLSDLGTILMRWLVQHMQVRLCIGYVRVMKTYVSAAVTLEKMCSHTWCLGCLNVNTQAYNYNKPQMLQINISSPAGLLPGAGMFGTYVFPCMACCDLPASVLKLHNVPRQVKKTHYQLIVSPWRVTTPPLLWQFQSVECRAAGWGYGFSVCDVYFRPADSVTLSCVHSTYVHDEACNYAWLPNVRKKRRVM